jgi:hypothetical protein
VIGFRRPRVCDIHYQPLPAAEARSRREARIDSRKLSALAPSSGVWLPPCLRKLSCIELSKDRDAGFHRSTFAENNFQNKRVLTPTNMHVLTYV